MSKTPSRNSVYGDDQAKRLEEALSVVSKQSKLMKRCLDNNKLMDGLKHCSAMLSELRSSVLSPKHYYELYMAIFDNLRHLTTFLGEAHSHGLHDLADLYELVQYAGNIIPRLYLMITVGSVFMSMPDAPIKEIMKDMMEMARGVQHPTRGLFLRHYLSGMTKDHLPIGDNDGPQGNLSDSIEFTLTNFVEMNKLWVRLQHQGHSREREKREAERKELRTLVGSNLVRLSQLEGIDLEVYKNRILPDLLEQIINCKDLIAQEYLMEAIIQVFQDDFHLRTLTPFLTSIASLHPELSTKNIVIAFIDRLAAYASREAENEAKRSEEAALLSTKKDEGETTEEENQKETKEDEEEIKLPKEPESPKNAVKTYRGIPEDIRLFEVFWKQVLELIEARKEMLFEDKTALLVSSANLALSCYPEKMAYINEVLSYAEESYQKFRSSHEAESTTVVNNLRSLLLIPIEQYNDLITILKLTNYTSLLSKQPYETRRTIANRLVSTLLQRQTVLSQNEHVEGIFGLINVLLKDQEDGGIKFAKIFGEISNKAQYEQDDVYVNELTSVAKLLNRVHSEDPETMLELLKTSLEAVSYGDIRVRYTIPPIVTSAIKLANQYAKISDKSEDVIASAKAIFKFIHNATTTLYNKTEAHDIAFRYFLSAALAADELELEDICYDFFVQAFTYYEECISESKAQLEAIMLLIGTLHTTRAFTKDNYDTLATKCVLHAGRLLKKPDQCRTICLAAHLFYVVPAKPSNSLIEPALGSSTNSLLIQRTDRLYRDSSRTLETLQRALKIADGVMDPLRKFELFVEISNQYIFFFTHGCTSMDARLINGLLSLTNLHLDNLESGNELDMSPFNQSGAPDLATPQLTRQSVTNYFKATLAHLRSLKNNPPTDTEQTEFHLLVDDPQSL